MTSCELYFPFSTTNVAVGRFTALNLFTAKQLKTQRDEPHPLNGHDANLDRQDGLEEAPLHDAVYIGVAIEYLKSG